MIYDYTFLLDQLNMGQWSYNVSSDKIFLDSKVLNLFQIESRDPILLRNWLAYLSHESQEAFKIAIKNLSHSAGPPIDLKLKLNKQEKWIRIIATNKTPKHIGDVSLYGICFEITHSVLIEEQLERQEKINYHQSKLASIGELAAGIGHEINNPLTIVKGSLYFAIKKFFNPSNDPNLERVRDQLIKGQNAIKRIEDIVLGLRRFSRNESEQYTKIDLNETIKQVYQFIHELYYRSGIQIDLSLPETPTFIYGNTGRIQQVFLNLFTNAKDALSKHSDAKINIELFPKNDQYIVSFSDNGSGIPPKLQNQIFENFFTTKEVGEGTGIGLSLSEKIISEHGGILTLQNSTPAGTTFQIEIPRYEAINQTQKKKYKILIVDDEPDLLEVFEDLLKSKGHQVSVANDGAEALHLINSLEFDIVFSDIKMPRMDGVTLFKKIQTQKQRMTLIAISGHIESKEYEKSEIYQLAHHTLKKPIDFTVIEEIICTKVPAAS